MEPAMNVKYLAIATFLVGVVTVVIGGFHHDQGHLIGGSIMLGAGLLALKDAK
jgi:hypothetical protein